MDNSTKEPVGSPASFLGYMYLSLVIQRWQCRLPFSVFPWSRLTILERGTSRYWQGRITKIQIILNNNNTQITIPKNTNNTQQFNIKSDVNKVHLSSPVEFSRVTAACAHGVAFIEKSARMQTRWSAALRNKSSMQHVYFCWLWRNVDFH